MFSLVEQAFACLGAQGKEKLLYAGGILVLGVEPADGHIENLCNLAHQFEVGGVFAALVLVHPGARRHRIDAGQFSKLFLG